jgi:hypothetical protein
MRAFSFFAALCIIGFMPSHGAAQDTQLLEQISPELPPQTTEYEPTTPWSLSRTEERCQLARNFSAGKQTITLIISQAHPGPKVQFGIFGSDIMKGRKSLSTNFLPDSTPEETSEILPATYAEQNGYLYLGMVYPYWFRLGNRDESKEKRQALRNSLLENSSHYIVRGASKSPIALKIGPVSVALGALRDCLDDRLAQWGISMAHIEKIKKKAQPRNTRQLATLIANERAPAARNLRWRNRVSIRLIVDENGRVANCHATDELSPLYLRELTCRNLLKYARFEPAQDGEGQAIKGVHFRSVTYQ